MKRAVLVVVLVLAVAVVSVASASFPEGSSCYMAEKMRWEAAYFNIQCLWDLLTGWIT